MTVVIYITNYFVEMLIYMWIFNYGMTTCGGLISLFYYVHANLLGLLVSILGQQYRLVVGLIP